MTKKIISVVLAMCMVISMFAVAGFAVSAEEDSYIIAGTANLCTTEWQADDATNEMTFNSSTGLYEKTYTDLQPDLYLFKVVKNVDWDYSWGGPLGNYYLQIDTACDATITFDPVTETVDVIASGKGVYQPTFDHIYAVGNGEDGWLNDIAWEPAAEENEMEEVDPGVYQITFEDVPEFNNWQIKFSAGSWAINWGGPKGDGADDSISYGQNKALTFDGANLIFAAPCDLAEVTFTLDISNFDASDGTGAVASVSYVPDEDAEYYIVAGESALCTANWEQGNFMNAMAYNGVSGLYEKTYKNVAPGTYQLKVVKNASWDTAWGSSLDNFYLVVEDTCDVTITFDDEAGVVGAVGDSLGVYNLDFDMDSVWCVGNGEEGWLNGYSWGDAFEEEDNLMVATETPGVYEITFEDVPEFNNWQFKFSTNGWANTWGAPKGEDADVTMTPNGKKFDLVYNGANIVFDCPTDIDSVTIHLDFTGMDYTTGLGAVCWITTDEVAEQDDAVCKFSAYNVSFDNSLAMNFYVSKDMYESLNDPYVVFYRDGAASEVREYEPVYDATKQRYGFTFKGIYPQLSVDNVTATLYGRDDNGTLYSKSSVKSIKDYAMSNLAKANVSAANKKVYVDVLNYAAAVQVVQNYKTDTLANADLTDAQKALGSQGDPVLDNIKGYTTDMENPAVVWKSMTVQLKDSVAVKFGFETEMDIEDVTVQFEIGNRTTVTYTSDDFEYDASNGRYYVLMDKAFANEFSDRLVATAYDADGNAISRTYKYSVESYAQGQVAKATTAANVKAMLNAMMNYGNAVVAASNHEVVK